MFCYRSVLKGVRQSGFIAIFTMMFVVGSQPAYGIPVLIQEVLYDGPGADADDVFTELFGSPGLSLAGWSLIGINGSNDSIYRTIDLTGAIIPDDGLLVIATSSANAGLAVFRDFTANVDWQNGPDAIQLLDPLGQITDALQYGIIAGIFRGEGSAASDVSAGRSLSRDRFGTDTNNNAFDFAALSSPTPGVGPDSLATVPLPSAFSLFALGLVSMGLQKKRLNSKKTKGISRGVVA